MAEQPCEDGFAREAEKDGIVLVEPWVDWLCELGHLGIEMVIDETDDDELIDRAAGTIEVLATIYRELGGDLAVRQSCRANLLVPGDFLHEATGTMIEVDTAPHFTSFRLLTLDLYPDDAPLGFDRDEYRELCRSLAPEYDGYQRNIAAKGFGIGGGQRQRAYRDALRDLGAPLLGLRPVVRIPAVDGDGAAAYLRNRESLLALLGGLPTH
jgi:hypothetical protein